MTDTHFSPDKPTPQERPPSRFAFVLAILALLCANIPYLIGILKTPTGGAFTGLLRNPDDGAVYLSWIQQASEGNFFLQNRFTTEPQHGLAFNLFFYLLGTIGRITPLSSPVIYGGARLVFGALLLWALWRLVTMVLRESRTQLLVFALLCFASGFGFGSDFDPRFAWEQPIDRWQPEAITFLALYVTPLFAAALALMVVFVTSFYRSEQSGKVRDIVPACVAGFLLGNFHSYDILQLFVFAGAYRLLTDIIHRRFTLPGYLRLALIGLAMLPTAGYQYWAIQNEAVFHARVFDTSTLSPSPVWVLAGFGLPFLMAIGTPFFAPARSKFLPDALRLLLVWGIIALAISYARDLHWHPVSFQRKLLMGVHIPICLVAGALLAAVTERLSGSLPTIVAFSTVLLTIPSNLRFILSDLGHLPGNISETQYRPYLSKDEDNALQYLQRNAKAGESVLVCPDMIAHKYGAAALLPYLGVYVPAYSSATVFCAHWSETARFGDKLKEQTRFFRATTSDADRQAFLAQNPSIHYIIYAHAVREGLTDNQGELLKDERTEAPYFTGVDWTDKGMLPSFLSPVYANTSVSIFRVAQAKDDVH